MSRSSAVLGLKAHENKAQGFSPVETDGASYATCKVARTSVIAINPDQSRLATFQVAQIVLLLFTGLKPCALFSWAFSPQRMTRFEKNSRATDAREIGIFNVRWDKWRFAARAHQHFSTIPDGGPALEASRSHPALKKAIAQIKTNGSLAFPVPAVTLASAKLDV